MTSVKESLRAAIRTIPDYPKPGILFRDITTLLGQPQAFRRAIDELVHPYAGTKIDKIAGIEARGFILGGAMAHQLSAGFIPIRKKGKLPHETVRIAYSLEYGIDEMEMHKDAVQPGEKVILVDDLIATGGTAEGATKLLRQMGADIVVGEGQSLGVGLNFGGPYVGLFACNEKYVRQMPGRLAGVTQDAEGQRGFVLTLSTREQHIRREKATSNICTNAGLCALAFSIHLTLLGETGLRKLAALNHAGAVAAADRLSRIAGVELVNDSFFNEFTLRLPVEARPVVRSLADKGILGGVSLGRLYPGAPDLAGGLVVAVTETASEEDVETLAQALEAEIAA